MTEMPQGATSTAHAAAMPDGYIARLPDDLRAEANALRQIHDLFWRGWHCPNQDCNVCASEPRPAEPLIASVPTIIIP